MGKKYISEHIMNDTARTDASSRAAPASRPIQFRHVLAMAMVMTGISAAASIGPAFAQAATEHQVASYLRRNPEVITDAISIMQQRAANDQQAVLARTAGPVSAKIAAGDAKVPFMGNPRGRAVVEYFDYNCGYCKKFAKDTATPMLAQDRNLKLYLVLTPILGEGSQRMAEYAAAAKIQNRFGPAHEFLIAQRAPTVQEAEAIRPRLIAAARLDKDAFDRAMSDGSAKAIVAHNLALSQRAGVRGTPMIYANGHVVPGAIDASQLRQMLAAR